MEDVIVVGAGPCGLAAAIALQDAGIGAVVIEKYNLVHSIYRYPTNLHFFSTPELLEIGGYPFPTPHDKPTRREALEYYRNVAQRRKLDVRPYEEATLIRKTAEGFFLVETERHGIKRFYESRAVVVATGYFDRPNAIGIPGEELPHVSHYFTEAHPYAGTKVAIIGGNNSAVDAAMELSRVGAEPFVVYRGDAAKQKIKPWVRPLFEGAVAKGAIGMLYNAQVVEIQPGRVRIRHADGSAETRDADFVLALTGFRPDRTLLGGAGAETKPETGAPVYDPETMETTVKGLYVAGVVASGEDANEVFIETGRHHGTAIARHLCAGRS
ncbi:YpdA family putative bacillithiol disulfide reductase [Paenibacillus antri]|uniref:YpdA family putative bacillithiol disulfide reductase n=1 Tax=Paenibacillus antri TaxID=2582848 RepID=A0A5R9GFQ6_9BACL|nr:YpdA family putative bacillithiol disulfide reductase [Paenibacillus antri]TLS50255.1 YpdA family putative bacillithiol disulfide reductase [Paenibacillus antri]